MKMTNKHIVHVFFVLILTMLVACKNSDNNKETIIKGKATIYVDESIVPIIEDQKAVFETQYKAELSLVNKSETEIVNSLLNDTAKIAVLPRKLTKKELKVFSNKKINPKETIFAIDAVVFIASSTSRDSLVSLQDVIQLMNGSKVQGIRGLVFDNPNSSAVRLLTEKAGLEIGSQENFFSFATTMEVVNYVAENEGMIGVVGVNWLFQSPLDKQSIVDKTKMLSVKSDNGFGYVYPSQENIGSGKYPLARHLYIINCQGYSGLGMGFASFVAGERGQRIVLKSGLVPVRYPSRNIVTRKKVLKENN
jgi:phosphate transport system substrate-binding protein